MVAIPMDDFNAKDAPPIPLGSPDQVTPLGPADPEGGPGYTQPPQADYMDDGQERSASWCCFWLRTCLCKDDRGENPNNWFLNCCANVWGTLTFIAVLLAIAAGVYAKEFVGEVRSNEESDTSPCGGVTATPCAGFIENMLVKMDSAIDFIQGGGLQDQLGVSDILGDLDPDQLAGMFLAEFDCGSDPSTGAAWDLGGDIDITNITNECQSQVDSAGDSATCDVLTLPTCSAATGESLPAWFTNYVPGVTHGDVCTLRVIQNGFSGTACGQWTWNLPGGAAAGYCDDYSDKDATACAGAGATYVDFAAGSALIPLDPNVDPTDANNQTTADDSVVTWTDRSGTSTQQTSGWSDQNGVEVEYNGAVYKAYAVVAADVHMYGPWVEVPAEGAADTICGYDDVNREAMAIPAEVTGGAAVDLKAQCEDILRVAAEALAAATGDVQAQLDGMTGDMGGGALTAGREQIRELRSTLSSVPIDWIAFALCLLGALIVLVSMLAFCCELRDQVKSDDRNACCGCLCCFCCPFWFLISCVLSIIAVVVFFAQAVVYTQLWDLIGMFLGEDASADPMVLINELLEKVEPTIASMIAQEGDETENVCTDPDSFFNLTGIGCIQAENAGVFEQVAAQLESQFPPSCISPRNGIEVLNCDDRSEQVTCESIGCDWFSFASTRTCDELLTNCQTMARELGQIPGVEGQEVDFSAAEDEINAKIDQICENVVGIEIPMGEAMTEDCKNFVFAFYFAVVSNGMLAALSLWGILLALWTGCKACMKKDHMV